MTKPKSSAHKREQARTRKQNQRSRSGAPGKEKAPRLTGSQIMQAAQSPMTPWFTDYIFRAVDGGFYETLREGIPICDAAIRRLVNLTGTPKIIGEKMELVTLLEDFHLNVPVNDMQKGLVAFSANHQNETHEQGFNLSEFVANRARDDIERLVVADSKQIVFRRNAASRLEPWIRSGKPLTTNYTMPGQLIQDILTTSYGRTVSYNGIEETRLDPDNKLYFSADNENQNPYGVSIFRSMEFVAQVLVTLQNSMKNSAERFGDPSYHAHYKGKAGDTKLEERRKTLETDLKTIMTAKRSGKSGDLTTAGGPDSEVKISIIGHEGQLFQYDIPLRHVLEQIVAKTNLPAWMLGIYWSTTERMATLEVEMALADAKIRQAAMLPEYIRLLSNFLKLRGRSWSSITTDPNKKGDWGIYFESPNVRDVVAMAQAEFLSAQAAQMRSGAAAMATIRNQGQEVPVGAASFEVNGMKFEVRTTGAGSPLPSRERAAGEGAASKAAHKKSACSCGHDHNLKLADIKEAQRPAPWPALDQLEAEYEKELKYDWRSLEVKIFDILGLRLPEAVPPESSQEGQAGKQPGRKVPFSFDDNQRAQIMKALKDYLGWYDPAGEDSSVTWYYAQAYSAGLIQAANMVGKERPLLDILKNEEIYADLVTNGFQLVKDNATRAVKNEIMDQMEQGMINGVNPRDVASKLDAIFDGQNSDWERLARTEMSAAAERAKLDEWKERGVDVSNAVTVPVHPRCRCSTTVEEVDGKWRAKFAPAPDACDWCLSLQEGDKRASAA
jgi:hypothetical protein